MRTTKTVLIVLPFVVGSRFPTFFNPPFAMGKEQISSQFRQWHLRFGGNRTNAPIVWR